ncbi:hypothetical protein MMC31_002237 [Peltigera leucophlebia]|nr:hypothetical protein [Peltigera leucophlebia]
MSSTAEDNLCLSIESLEINQTEKLEHLLVCYLDLLNQYTTLREHLSQKLSSGFLTLAQANFQSPNRARYGQDFYDDRMRASTLVSLIPIDSFSKVEFSLLQRRNALSSPSESGASPVESSPSDLSSPSPSPSHAPPQTDSASAKSAPEFSPGVSSSSDFSLAPDPHIRSHTEPSHELCSESPVGPSSENVPKSSSQAEFEAPSSGPATSKQTTSPPPSCDPLNWFGILVPSALRRTQTSFKAVVEEIVPRIVTVDREMRQLEIEVRRTRKKLLQAEKGAAKAAATED